MSNFNAQELRRRKLDEGVQQWSCRKKVVEGDTNNKLSVAKNLEVNLQVFEADLS